MNMKTKQALMAFKDAAIELSIAWENEEDTEVLNQGYPFDECFEEITSKIVSWQSEIVNKATLNRGG